MSMLMSMSMSMFAEYESKYLLNLPTAEAGGDVPTFIHV